MANIKDPAFWRRFSLAVHLAEDEKTSPDSDRAVQSQKAVEHTYAFIFMNLQSL